MKPFALFLLAALLPASLRAQDRLRIQEVGLQGYYSTDVPTPVRIHIPALPRSQTINLVFTVDSNYNEQAERWLRTDRFEKPVQVISGQPLDVELPILLAGYGKLKSRVVETDSQGGTLGEDDRDLSLVKMSPTIAIYCREDSQCYEAQEQIYPVQARKDASNPSAALEFALLKELWSDWLAYRAAGAVIIAGSISAMTADQGKALECYLRSGGILIILEKEAANTSFLSAYGQGAAHAWPERVGKGFLYRLPSLKTHDLNKLFAEKGQYGQGRMIFSKGASPSAVNWLLQRISVSFTFPRLRWLLIWISVYILIIGVVNFAILRRLRKLEWGWVTVSVTALVFSGGLYIISSWHRPRHFTLDGATVYWMDAHSPLAHEERGFRVSSPERTQLGLIIDDDVVLNTSLGIVSFRSSGVNVGSEMTDKQTMEPGWLVRLGPPLQLETPMLRWSFKDFYTEGFHEFPGTVHWTTAMHLKNDMGRSFREGIYLDYKAKKWYSIPGMAPGEEIDLASLVPRDFYKPLPPFPLRMSKAVRPGIQRPFSINEFPNAGIRFAAADHVFAGVIEPAEKNARLDAEGTTEQNVALAVVLLDQP
jgi:hypothetical protein